MREMVDPGNPPQRLAIEASARIEHRWPDAEPDGPGLDLGGDVRHLVVAEGLLDENSVAGRVREGMGGDPVRVAVGLSTLPDHLDERQGQLAVELVGVVVIQPEVRVDVAKDSVRVVVEVDASLEQGRVVHARDAEVGTVEVRRYRGQRPAHDPALAPTGVEETTALDEALATRPEGRIRCETVLMDHRPANEEEVEHALLEAIGDRGESG